MLIVAYPNHRFTPPKNTLPPLIRMRENLLSSPQRFTHPMKKLEPEVVDYAVVGVFVKVIGTPQVAQISVIAE